MNTFSKMNLRTTEDVEKFVLGIAPGEVLRCRAGLDVCVGDHIAPKGGAEIGDALEELVRDARGGLDPHAIHLRYEHLHPFTDGSGRSGRVLWLWCMKRAGRLDEALALGFLRLWYYESLRAFDAEKRSMYDKPQ